MSTEVTADDIADAFMRKGGDRVKWPIHNCGYCGYSCGFIVEAGGGAVFYDSGCDCTWDGMRPASFQEIANHINVQTNPTAKASLLEWWGIPDSDPTTIAEDAS